MPRKQLRQLTIKPRMKQSQALYEGLEYYFPLATSMQFDPRYRGLYRTKDNVPMESIDPDYSDEKYLPEQVDNGDKVDNMDAEKVFANLLKTSSAVQKAVSIQKAQGKIHSLTTKNKKLSEENTKLKKQIGKLVRMVTSLNRHVPDHIKIKYTI